MSQILKLDRNGKRIPKGSGERPNRYQVRWRDPDGRQRARSFRRAVDAGAFRDQLGTDMRAGSYIDPDAGRETVAVFARQWAAGQPWRNSTRERTEHILNKQIIPRFGRTPLRSVRPSDVQAWVAEMSASGLAPTTVESYFLTFASIMKAARLDDLIRIAPTDRIGLPRAERNSAALVPLTVDEVHALAEAVPRRYRALILASAGLGLRQGEACGLTTDRVDFLRRQVRIDRQLVTPSGKGEARFGPPKTTASNRVIALPDSVGEVLAAHIAEFEPGENGVIFTSRTGAKIRRSTWSSAFASAAKTIGLAASSHDLRHHCASLLVASGCSVKAVQQYLGHKNASETLDTYGHLWPGDEDRIRAAIDVGLRRNVHEMCTNESARQRLAARKS